MAQDNDDGATRLDSRNGRDREYDETRDPTGPSPRTDGEPTRAKHATSSEG